ncbi:MAG: hypothetical protein Q9163_000750 [Psora crenata]
MSDDRSTREEAHTHPTRQLNLFPAGTSLSYHKPCHSSAVPPSGNEEYAPPPGPPRCSMSPSIRDVTSQEPPPYHDWTVVPETALLPPPPSVGHETGVAGNADSREADRARGWCKRNPLVFPHQPTPAQATAVRNGDVRLMRPREYNGELLMSSTGDGRRFVNDWLGGIDFTDPFKAGDTVGIGMSFSLPNQPPAYNFAPEQALLKSEVEVFFTRNGLKEGGWNLHEERDYEKGVDGLEGLFDLYGAIGIFGGAEFRIIFKREEWLWRPR